MSKSLRREAYDVLRRFVRGEAGWPEVEGIARRLRLKGVGEICESLSLPVNQILEVDLDLGNIARRIHAYLEGGLSRESTHLWFSHMQHLAASRSGEPTLSHVMIDAVLAILSEVLYPRSFALPDELPRSLERMCASIEEMGSSNSRDIMPCLVEDALHALGSVQFVALKGSVVFGGASKGQWIDVGWRSSSQKEIGFIPFSVFTRHFFRDELPEIFSKIAESMHLAWARQDPFAYHPENDQAGILTKRFPGLAECGPAFHYYIDEVGLAEIVIDAPILGREEILFAAKLFCLKNGLKRATLNGRRISCAGAASP